MLRGYCKPRLGCEAFTKTISEKYLKDKKLSPEISQQKYLRPIFSFKQITHVVAGNYKVNEVNLKTVKHKAGNKPRQIAIYLACRLSEQKYKIIADEFTNITVAGITKTFQRITKAIAIDSKLNEDVILLEKRLKNCCILTKIAKNCGSRRL